MSTRIISITLNQTVQSFPFRLRNKVSFRVHWGRLAGRKRPGRARKQADARKKWGSYENCKVNTFSELNLQVTTGFGHPPGIFIG